MGAGKAREGRGLVPATTSNAACAHACLNPKGQVICVTLRRCRLVVGLDPRPGGALHRHATHPGAGYVPSRAGSSTVICSMVFSGESCDSRA